MSFDAIYNETSVSSTNNTSYSTSSSTTNTASDTNIQMVRKKTDAEIAAKLGVSIEVLQELRIKNPDFGTYKFEDQQKLANLLSNNPETTKATEVETVNKNTYSQSIDDFDFEAFTNLEPEEKLNTLIEQRAKTQFILGSEPQKTEEEWAALTDDAKQAFLDKQFEQLKALGQEYGEEMKAKGDNFSSSLNKFMKMDLIAAKNGKTSKEFIGSSKAEQSVLTYKYIDDKIKSGKEDTLTDNEHVVYEQETLLLNAIKHHVTKTPENDSVVKDMTYSTAIDTIKTRELNISDINYDYLISKDASGIELTDLEKKELDAHGELHNSAIYKIVKDDIGKEIGQPPDLLAEEPDGFTFESDTTNKKERNSEYVAALIDHYVKNDDKEKLTLFTIDALKKDRTHLAKTLYEKISQMEGGQEYLANPDDELLQAYGSTNVEKLGEYGKSYTQKMLDNENLPEEFKVAASSDIVTNSAEEQKVSIGKVFIANKTESIAVFSSEMAVSSEISETQLELSNLIAESDNKNLKLYHTNNIPELNTDVEMSVAQTFINLKDEDISLAMSQNTSKMHQDNQVEYQAMVHEASYDFSDDVAKNIQTNLANDIQNAHADNQAALHENISSSKFSEIAELAASNISNYAETAQAEAITTSLATNNENVVKIIEQNIESYSATALKEVISSVLEKTLALAEADEETNLTGTLTASEISKLSASEKAEYYEYVFEKASAREKITMLEKIPGIQQKTIFTAICKFYPNLMNTMIDAGKGPMLVESGIPGSASNKVFAEMERIAPTNNNIAKQLVEYKDDKRYALYAQSRNLAEATKPDETDETAQSNNEYTSNPFDEYLTTNRRKTAAINPTGTAGRLDLSV
ncbi:MAG: hypothetical protein R3Y28_03345 [Candidatus Gastranaerophilales bacterium]